MTSCECSFYMWLNMRMIADTTRQVRGLPGPDPD